MRPISRSLSLRPGAFAATILSLLFSCATVPVQPPLEGGSIPIMGYLEVPQQRFVEFAMTKNPALGNQRWSAVWEAYRDACRAEGVNQGVALVQMLHETAYLKFGGTVQARQNNFAGLGVTGGGVEGLSFPDVPTGALAHVQHLKAYASTDPLHRPSVDPRFKYVRRGTAPSVAELTGRWATDPAYGKKLTALYRQLVSS